MTADIDAQILPEAPGRSMPAALDAAEVVPHCGRPPRWIAGEIGQLVPVGVVRRRKDHGVVRGTPAKRAGARIPDAVLAGDELRIAGLLGTIAVVTDEKVPAHRRVFRCEGVE